MRICGKEMQEMLTCVHCGKKFTRPSKMGPLPRFCKNSCRQRDFEKQKVERLKSRISELEEIIKIITEKRDDDPELF